MNDEQKAALDLAVLNLKTHGDDQLLRAVQPLIEYYEARALLSDGGKGEAGCSMGVGCDEAGVCYAMAHGQPERCAAPQAECAPRALTDEQIHEIWVKSTAHTISRRVAVEFARAIEQAVREPK
ncbi:hypothetical protein BGLT_05202 [Caballeronia glathei]|uniref:Uncharacterized protein n=1 Tax=Caballeronia glathei TaxID=60547 RepID=A0A069PFG1_9BURK|nr:hypothetical protein [Caballeronia glathei]KDR39217.1 hypothetical protein BG61_34295 [Caballeronia glathei]CDY76130.1 hypothetical protein BGLT_05202 [Caballeronia glathei]